MTVTAPELPAVPTDDTGPLGGATPGTATDVPTEATATPDAQPSVADGPADGAREVWQDPVTAHAEIDRLTARVAELETASAEAAALSARAEAAELETATVRARLDRVLIGHAKGLPDVLAERLVGTDRAALESDADALLTVLADYATAHPRTPVMLPDPDQALPGTAGEGDPAQILAGIIQNNMT